MKTTFYSLLLILLTTSGCSAQSGLFKKAESILKGSGSGSLSTDQVVAGLKEALNQGVNKGTSKLSAVDGFFKDAVLKIILPPEAQKVEKTLRAIGMGKLVDDAILSMNRGAEDAAKSAAPIFIDAVKQMSIADAWSILKGSDTAATGYLRLKTTSSLTAAFKPVIDNSLSKVDATRYWNTMITAYNKVPMVKKINPDLGSYVTEKALAGVFYKIGEEEKNIRHNPAARVTDILKKVFAQ
jgi:hypothetical protein